MRLRLLPRSLFGRMLLILFAGLAVMQIVTTALLLRERLHQISYVRRVELSFRLKSTIRALESVNGQQRLELASLLSQPDFQLSLSPSDAPKGINPFAFDDQEKSYFTPLREALGMQRSIELKLFKRYPDEPPLERQRGMGPGRGMGMMRGDGKHHGHMEQSANERYPDRPERKDFRTFYKQTPSPLGLAVTVALNDGSHLTAYIRDFITEPPPPEAALVYLGSLLLGVSVLTFCAVRLATTPVRRLGTAADQLGLNLHAPPLPEEGPSELRQAAIAFNRMQKRLIETLNERTQIMAAISHDLQTPITRMRLRAELVEDDELQNKFIADLDMMHALIREGLDLARSMDQENNRQSIDLTTLLETIADDAEDTGQSVTLIAPPRVLYIGSLTGLRRAFTNLIDNAVKFGGAAEIRLEDDGTNVRITIRDRGPGIPEAHLEDVLKPFYRMEASRNRETGGTGLGLAIANNIAINHGGNLVLRNHPEGGLEAIFTLPRFQKTSSVQPKKKKNDGKEQDETAG